jgi:Fe-Mn family superoxide dismutase
MDGSGRAKGTAGLRPFELAPLPFPLRSLSPTVSPLTLRTHHGVHHANYVKKANKLAQEAGLATLPQVQIIQRAYADPALKGLHDNAAQAWNHDFYWKSLSPQRQSPRGELRAAVKRAFGSPRELVNAIVEAGTAHFGSGWVWLCALGDRLEVHSTPNADSPLLTGDLPLIVFDVWEHAYYLDYKQDRKSHLKALVSAHANWEFAARRFAGD